MTFLHGTGFPPKKRPSGSVSIGGYSENGQEITRARANSDRVALSHRRPTLIELQKMVILEGAHRITKRPQILLCWPILRDSQEFYYDLRTISVNLTKLAANSAEIDEKSIASNLLC